jgi:high-affinity K+ transport system ATPase subunit B
VGERRAGSNDEFPNDALRLHGLLWRNLPIWGLGGVVAPSLGIKLIDVLLVALDLVR